MVRVGDVNHAGGVDRLSVEHRLRGLLVKGEEINRRVRGSLQQPGAERDREDEERRAPRDDERTLHRTDAEEVDGVRGDEDDDHRCQRVVPAEVRTDVRTGGASEGERGGPECDEPGQALPLSSQERDAHRRRVEGLAPCRDAHDDEREEDAGGERADGVDCGVVAEDPERHSGVTEQGQLQGGARAHERT